MIRTFYPVFTAVVLSSGCSSSQNALPYDLIATSDGIGAIHPNEVFDPRLIESKLPGFSIESMAQITPEKGKMILLLKRNGETLAYITSDKDGKHIQQITVTSKLIRDKYNHRIGDQLVPQNKLTCEGNACHYTDAPNLLYQCNPDHTIREITVQKL